MFQNTIRNIKNLESVPLRELRVIVENDFDVNQEFSVEEKNLMKFLYSRRLNVAETYSLIQNYVKYREDNALLFDNLNIQDQEVKAAIENSLPELLPQKDRKCRSIIVFHANNWYESISLTSIYRALLLCLDFALQDIHTQNNGFVVIVNWDQFTIKKTTWLNPRIINSMIYGLQECYPAKFMEVHFVATPWYINAAFNIFKLSFNDDIKENFFVHGRNLSSLHDFIHKDVLPTELGGSKPSYNTANMVEELESYCQKH